MIKSIVAFVVVCMPLLLYAQFSDDFSDGDFISNPAWYGNVEKFIVEDNMLRLNDQAAGQAWLATASGLVNNTQWELWLRLAFTPSNNNHPRVYLVSDSQNLGEALNGYYIRIGKDGGDNKRLYFYRQDGTVSTEIMAGSMNLAATTNNRIRIKVTRDFDGNWDFFADPAGGHLFTPQGSVNDAYHTVSGWFGVLCRYTVSNANRFYFDDFFVNEIVPDTVPPAVDAIQVVSSNTLKVIFSKVVDNASAENVNNYTINQGIGNPIVASPDPSMPNEVSLVFPQNFLSNIVYTMQIQNVQDHAGNTMADYSGEFVDYHPLPFDLVFNELMANPTPVVGLPDHEYIELYNTTDFPVDIEGWTLQHGNTRRPIPFASIPAKGFILLVTEAAFPHFQSYGNVVAVPGLSAIALTNAGTDLLLFDSQDMLISFVSYSDEWYRDPAKSNGGWSLEKIDPYNFCQGRENWRAATDPKGGTPAAPNSVQASNPDVTPPDLIRAGYIDNNTMTLFFSEPMDRTSLEDIANYQVSPDLGGAFYATALLPDFSKVTLSFEQSMEAGVVYEIALNTRLTDCTGNPIQKRTARVAIPQVAEAMDVVINEVLFNPPDQGSRYIELYNRSHKVIDLKDHLMTSKDTVDGFFTTIQEISSLSYLFFPDEYLVLTTNPDAVKRTYMTPSPEAFVRMGGMPRMTNANGVLVFANKSLQQIDMFVYEEDMHLALLTNYQGVALERLNPNWPTQDRSNWHSAAQSVGFGTPGFRNSQYTTTQTAVVGHFELDPEVFSPDGDGVDDLLSISYSLDRPGYVANIRVFDSRGRLITYLSRGELLSTSGVITWDGTTDTSQKAPLGIYIVHIELFDLQGQVRNFRKTAVLGGRL
jgi:hypothetical protein